MAEVRNRPTLSRGQVFVAVSLLCYGVAAFVVGLQVGRRAPDESGTNRTEEVISETLLRSLTRPAAAAGDFDADPLEAFMEVYQHLKDKYVEEITDADKQRLSYGAIRGMLRELGDPYTRFMEPTDFGDFKVDTQGHFAGIGAMLGIDRKTHKIQVIRVFENNPAAKAGLKAGDFIIQIDGADTVDMSLDVAVNRIRGQAGTDVTLTVERLPDKPDAEPDADLLKKLGRDPEEPRTDPAPVVGDTLDVKITRADIDVPVVESEMMSDKVGYVYLGGFNEQSYPQLRKAIQDLEAKGAQKLIFDLRSNPGGMLEVAQEVASLFIKSGPVVFVQERSRAAETLTVDPSKTMAKQLPMVVLVNRFSASASEIVSGALQDHGRAKVVGETTYGKGLVQTVVPLSDSSAVAITTAKYLTPNKRDINKKGIEPDVPVAINTEDPELIEGARSGEPREQWDPQVKKAIELLQKEPAQ